MIGRDILAGLHRQHGERLADFRMRSPDAGDAEPGMVLHREQPFCLALLARFERRRELIETVGRNEAAVRSELAALGAEIIDRPPILARPAPSPIDELARSPALAAAH